MLKLQRSARFEMTSPHLGVGGGGDGMLKLQRGARFEMTSPHLGGRGGWNVKTTERRSF